MVASGIVGLLSSSGIHWACSDLEEKYLILHSLLPLSTLYIKKIVAKQVVLLIEQFCNPLGKYSLINNDDFVLPSHLILSSPLLLAF